jgi:hypothetical protein
MSGKSVLPGIAMLCAVGAVIAFTARPGARPVAEAATPPGALTFSEDFAPADRRWVLAAIAEARPEARRLIAAVAGRTRVVPFYEPHGYWLGWAGPRTAARYRVRLNLARLNGSRTIDRSAVTLHELGHIVDYALVPDDLRDRLAAQVPRSGVCPTRILADCAAPEERFADTFAKWALRGNVSLTGAGYSLPAPPSLEDWGAPLARLTIELDVAARR